ncbi:XP_034973555.1uncharacterized protein LOC118086255 [Podarcis lilfordi]|uniref:XP_034973555.1uncharacterized protein LOC118086255 n=1 Tax=Podarcis lilfordi TaxID=74358 RepID=A0AA35PAK9_9SAUR|nr:XP_034973555.1uncharacterized protein LOC118086255 [Podarcis lilfordi]
MHFSRKKVHLSEDSHLSFRYKFFIRIFSCVGLVGLFISLLSPSWIEIFHKDFVTNLGLWNICINRRCKRIRLNSSSKISWANTIVREWLEDEEWLEASAREFPRETPEECSEPGDILLVTRILMSISTFLGLVAAACSLLSSTSLRLSRWPAVTNLCTGIISLVTMVLYGTSISPNSTLGSPIPHTTSPKYLSWSFGIGCLASFLFLTNILLFILIELEGNTSTHDDLKPKQRRLILVT